MQHTAGIHSVLVPCICLGTLKSIYQNERNKSRSCPTEVCSRHAVKEAIVLQLLHFCRKAYTWSVACYSVSRVKDSGMFSVAAQAAEAGYLSTNFSLVNWVIIAELLLTCHWVCPLMWQDIEEMSGKWGPVSTTVKRQRRGRAKEMPPCLCDLLEGAQADSHTF